MTDTTVEITTDTKKPPRRKTAKRRKRSAAPRPPAAAKAEPPAAILAENFDDLAGMTPMTCPSGCTSERCIISTVNVCKHPSMTGDAGSGPITMRNRERAKRFLKLQKI